MGESTLRELLAGPEPVLAPGASAAGVAALHIEDQVAPKRWGYVSNMFVREEMRNRGIGGALLRAVTTTAEERGYARLVLSPSERALPFYPRAGFVVPDDAAGDDRLLVRPVRRVDQRHGDRAP